MEKDNEKENVCDTANQSLPFMDEKIDAESNSVFILFMPKGESALVICILTFYALMDSSLWFDAINLEWSIAFIEGSQVIPST